MKSILIVDDDTSLGYSFRSVLEDRYRIFLAENSTEAKRILSIETADLCLLDYKLGTENGLDLLKELKLTWPTQKIIMMTAFGSSEVVLDSIQSGALDYLVKPIDLDVLESIIAKHLGEFENTSSQSSLSVDDIPVNKGEFMGTSEKVTAVIKKVALVAGTNTPTLITGDSGTGKELIARMLHQRSARRNEPFIVINCAAIPESLLESELFGHKKGAFSGASENREGKFSFAHRGTLFLDEIGDTPLNIQAKMLRVLQEGTIERLGDNKTQIVDVRIISATNQDLIDKIDNGTFRSDLFFRLNGMNIHLPPLRKRIDDIRGLLLHFVKIYSAELNKNIRMINDEVLSIFEQYPWPGNVRELQNVIRQAVILTEGYRISREQIIIDGPKIDAAAGDMQKNGLYQHFSALYKEDLLNKSVANLENELVNECLKKNRYQLSKTAKCLGISRVTLNAKIKKYQLDR